MIHALALVGPTASGKTFFSLRIAEELGCEILSLDSMQIYRGMDIGTAKATPEERSRVPHHLIDICAPEEDFSAEDYRAAALPLARGIEARGKIPLFVGGTGLYLDTLMRGIRTPVPESRREERDALLENTDTEEGRIVLWQKLNAVDPESAAAVHYNNVRRVARALEIFLATGRKKSDLDRENGLPNPEIGIGVFVLDWHRRENLYRQIDRRVDEMLANGLSDEVRRLRAGGLAEETTAAQAIGYKEFFAVLRGEITEAEAAEAIRTATKHYAKRQQTWFRHEKNARFVFLDSEDGTPRKKDDILSELLPAMKRSFGENKEQL